MTVRRNQVQRRKVSSFSPTAISGLKLWMRPDLNVTTVSGQVTGWLDMMGTANVFSNTGTHITQGAGINGRVAINFSSTDSYLSSTSTLSQVMTASAWTALIVFQYTGAAAEGANYYTNPFVIGDADNAFWGLTTSTTKLDAGQFNGTTFNVDQTTITTSTNYVAIAKYDGAHIFTAVNSNTFDAGTAATNISSLATALRIGKNNGATVGFKGAIGDILIFNQTLSVSSCNELMAWARAKYGI